VSDRVLMLEPVVGWPREVQPGGRYELTADLRAPTGPGSWPFDEEEFEFTCMLDAQPLFTTRILGEPVLVLHRFGGTYGPVRYELTAAEPADGLTGDDYLEPGDRGAVSIWLSFANSWGVPVRTVELPVRCDRRVPAGGTQVQPAAAEDQPGPAAAEVPEEQPEPESRRRDPLPDRSAALDHVVVVMFGGRSFDNMLGQLYHPGEIASFEGIAGRDLSNPIPAWANLSGDVGYRGAPGLRYLSAPPADEFAHVNTQLFGLIDPPSNRGMAARHMAAPYNTPADREQRPTMDGFVTDYISAFMAEQGRLPEFEEYLQIMAGYAPRQVPVISALARGFATFDHWFSEVPGPAFPNLSFVHAGTSSGYVENARPAASFPLRNTAETIFERLEARGLTWRVYCDPQASVSLTGLIHAPRLFRRFATNFSTIDRFLADAAAGTLPAYSFIEPDFLSGSTDMRTEPGLLSGDSQLDPPSSVLGGEDLLATVYNAIRSAAAPAGSNAYNTFLLITFDGHGGHYDHVVPPGVLPPDPSGPAGQVGFRFDRSGLRVPAIAVSAWIRRLTVVNDQYRHASVIRTLRERWTLGAPLTARDAAALDLSPVLGLDKPRPAADWPDVIPRPGPAFRPARSSLAPRLTSAALFATVELSRDMGLPAPTLDQDLALSEGDALALISDVFGHMFPGLRAAS
jgi:phospholipase C